MGCPWGAHGVFVGLLLGVRGVSVGCPWSVGCMVPVGCPWGVYGATKWCPWAAHGFVDGVSMRRA